VATELGGSARVEEFVEPVEAPPSPAQPPGPRVEVAASAVVRRSSSGGIVCPRCGWEEESDARFCSLCLCRFNKTDKIDVHGLQPGNNPTLNPLGPEEGAPAGSGGFRRVLAGRPVTLYVLGTGLVLLIAILVATHR
jgi:hypothetical protein